MSCDTIPPVRGKSYRTREGLRFDCLDSVPADPAYPVFGMLWSKDGSKIGASYTRDGNYWSSKSVSPLDIVAEWDDPAKPDTVAPVAGKSYRTREGSRFDCQRVQNRPGVPFPVKGEIGGIREWYMRDGRYLRSGPSRFDLIAEWEELETPKPNPLFQCRQVTYWSA